jgi:hypothetical protein
MIDRQGCLVVIVISIYFIPANVLALFFLHPYVTGNYLSMFTHFSKASNNARDWRKVATGILSFNACSAIRLNRRRVSLKLIIEFNFFFMERRNNCWSARAHILSFRRTISPFAKLFRLTLIISLKRFKLLRISFEMRVDLCWLHSYICFAALWKT